VNLDAGLRGRIGTSVIDLDLEWIEGARGRGRTQNDDDQRQRRVEGAYGRYR
jgi:hypothetical protein